MRYLKMSRAIAAVSAAMFVFLSGPGAVQAQTITNVKPTLSVGSSISQTQVAQTNVNEAGQHAKLNGSAALIAQSITQTAINFNANIWLWNTPADELNLSGILSGFDYSTIDPMLGQTDGGGLAPSVPDPSALVSLPILPGSLIVQTIEQTELNFSINQWDIPIGGQDFALDNSVFPLAIYQLNVNDARQVVFAPGSLGIVAQTIKQTALNFDADIHPDAGLSFLLDPAAILHQYGSFPLEPVLPDLALPFDSQAGPSLASDSQADPSLGGLTADIVLQTINQVSLNINFNLFNLYGDAPGADSTLGNVSFTPDVYQVNVNNAWQAVNPVPEPASLGLLGMAFGSLLVTRRRKIAVYRVV
jgi:PEP-CTERM motif-containing protein